MAFFLCGVGFLANLVGGVMILFAAFRKSVGWGLACLFIPFVGLVFVIQNWDETKNGFFASLGGGVLFFLGAIMLASTQQPKLEPQTQTVQASAVPTPAPQPYEPPRSAYTPSPYTPALSTAPAPAPTTTVVEEKKKTLEMVYIDRNTRTYYSEKCKRKPENVARVAKTVALMQGYTPAKCK